MSGHSKWSTIKHKKGALDAKRGKIFTKILKEITISAKSGGDPVSNPRLRLAIEKAKENNVPKDNIERAIKKGTGELEGLSYEEYTYEGYAPAGVAVLVEVLTDNKNRTGGEVRHVFTKSGNSLAEAGAVAWNFERKGCITLKNKTEEDVLEEAMNMGIEDLETHDKDVVLYCGLDIFEEAQKTLREKYEMEAEMIMKPKNTLMIDNLEDATKVLDLIDKLEDHDDVQKVWANFDLSPDVLKQLESN